VQEQGRIKQRLEGELSKARERINQVAAEKKLIEEQIEKSSYAQDDKDKTISQQRLEIDQLKRKLDTIQSIFDKRPIVEEPHTHPHPKPARPPVVAKNPPDVAKNPPDVTPKAPKQPIVKAVKPKPEITNPVDKPAPIKEPILVKEPIPVKEPTPPSDAEPVIEKPLVSVLTKSGVKKPAVPKNPVIKPVEETPKTPETQREAVVPVKEPIPVKEPVPPKLKKHRLQLILMNHQGSMNLLD